ncbi:formyltransferase family protein [Halobacterium rubrum]|uniref:formyltransferase family protein n=1 Tax=Halobacterium TaxID=2239 RepID=UPI001F41808D|nr:MULTISPECIES: formyltransferase family protein [Halobacterium]MDH5021544.1 formyltransferase family protein [Halobacterium rubrum]
MTDGASTRVALLTHGETLPQWAAAAVEQLTAVDGVEIPLVVADASGSERSAVEVLQRLVELREWGVLAGVQEVFGPDLPALEPLRIRDLDGLAAPDWLACEPESVDGWKHRLPERVVDRLRAVDVAVRFGFGFLVGDALTAPDRGVLSFHHGDIREYRGQPMGFWEYVHGEETAGVTLQRINETLDGGELVVTREVAIGDAPTWGAVRQRLFDASEGMLAEAVRRLRSPGFEPESPSAADLGDHYTLPEGQPVATYVRKTAAGLLLDGGFRDPNR